MNHNLIVLVIVVPLLLWRVYSRLQRNVGRQAFKSSGLAVGFSAFILLSLVFGAVSVGHQKLMLGYACGFVPGVALGFWALHLTRFEVTSEGRFYTPNTHIGVALTLVLIGRIIYRMAVLYLHASPTGGMPPPVGSSALTFAAFELLAGYYIVFNGGVMRYFGRSDAPAVPSQ